MVDCFFCQIAAREQPADIVHSTEHVVAFRDINPQAPTHLLIISREHIESARALRDRHAAVLAEIFQAAGHLARAEGVDSSGWRLVTNVGPDAGQSVHHLHFHLLGGRHMGWPPG
ncbi:MAG TPA: histidine triad nucleotide-binding protein [Actinomycetota bacterium]|nr:histidine triad nucleotide-binding protein [Actinomycetota bacterium]